MSLSSLRRNRNLVQSSYGWGWVLSAILTFISTFFTQSFSHQQT